MSFNPNGEWDDWLATAFAVVVSTAFGAFVLYAFACVPTDLRL